MSSRRREGAGEVSRMLDLLKQLLNPQAVTRDGIEREQANRIEELQAENSALRRALHELLRTHEAMKKYYRLKRKDETTT